MNIPAATPQEYIDTIPEERKEIFNALRTAILENMSAELEECISYKMIGYVVPKSVYPAGYHCNTDLPLPFANLASQKNFIAFYHMGLYADKALMSWFVDEYQKISKYKLDMGKSCVRFKKMNDIPVDLIGKLMSKMSAQEWIELYEKNIKK